MNLSQKLENLSIVIVTHAFSTGPGQELEEYLKDKVKSLTFIGHPFLHANDIRSFLKEYKEGKIKNKKISREWKLKEPIIYFKDLICTLFWVFNSRKKFDIYVGADPLNAFTGLLLKKLGKVDKVIFYTVDYVPKRFNNKALNKFYHSIDSYCVKNCDKVWNLSERMIEAREKKGVKRDERQLVVPIGVHFDRIERLSPEKINRKHLVYMGHHRRGQGLELIIEVFPNIVKKIPDIRLITVGGGYLLDELKNRTIELGLESHVDFKGFIKDHKDLEKILAKCSVGLAVYEPSSESFSWYADPSKPKQYMACGLPVIITDVPWYARDIQKNKAGILIDYNKQELENSIIKFLTDDKFYQEYKKNAIEFASNLDWSEIFEKTFHKIVF
jgi:glycosyltransferase involved in cell wall biosynthesis